MLGPSRSGCAGLSAQVRPVRLPRDGGSPPRAPACRAAGQPNGPPVFAIVPADESRWRNVARSPNVLGFLQHAFCRSVFSFGIFRSACCRPQSRGCRPHGVPSSQPINWGLIDRLLRAIRNVSALRFLADITPLDWNVRSPSKADIRRGGRDVR
jgi:hypothetical protein